MGLVFGLAESPCLGFSEYHHFHCGVSRLISRPASNTQLFWKLNSTVSVYKDKSSHFAYAARAALVHRCATVAIRKCCLSSACHIFTCLSRREIQCYVFACASEKTDQVCWNNEKPAVFKESISVYLAPNLPDQHKGQKLKAACREQSAGEVREDSAIR